MYIENFKIFFLVCEPSGIVGGIMVAAGAIITITETITIIIIITIEDGKISFIFSNH
jgi:hypothetical protein